MGQAFITLCCDFRRVFTTTNDFIPDEDPDYDDEVALEGNVYLVICALDYEKTATPLSCSVDGRNMEALAKACEIPDENVIALYDRVPAACTKENVVQVIEQMGDKCMEGDTFIFYYSGHGVNLKDYSGDEADGQDEAFVFVDDVGQINYESCMSDDEFADMITDAIPYRTRMYILTDCCHAGTICDFDSRKAKWAGRKAVSITGCLDSQTAGDIGRGGVFTHSMLCAIGELQQEDEDEYCTAKLYNRTLRKDCDIFRSAQDITLQCSPGVKANQLPWPLIPQVSYQPPLTKRG